MTDPSDFDKQVLTSYGIHDDDDISTERLLSMVAEDCHCDTNDVVDALLRNEGGFK